MPIASPSWRAVLLIPDARPPWAGGSTPRCVKVASGLARPTPAPTTISPASRCSHDESESTPVISSSPAAVSAMPSASAPVSGTRPAIRPALSEVTNATSARGAGGGQHRARGGGPQPQADLDRAAPADVEQEQRQVDEDAERAAGERRDDHRRAEERAVPEQAQVEHRVSRPQLDGGERRQRDRAADHEAEYLRARPPERVAA